MGRPPFLRHGVRSTLSTCAQDRSCGKFRWANIRLWSRRESVTQARRISEDQLPRRVALYLLRVHRTKRSAHLIPILGQILWEYKLPAAGYATPSVYVIDGRQYVVIAAGGGGKNATKYGDSIIAFALPSEEEPSSTGKVDDSGWTDLFDGKTLNGWVHLNGSHRYTVEDGAIVGRTVAGSRNSFLCTKKEFGDFELELDVMVDSVTNSGIQIRSKVRPFTIGEGYDMRAGRVNGPQVEMQRNHRSGTPTTGLIYGEALGTGWLSAEEKIQNGHHYLHNEGWNKLRIVARGSAYPDLGEWPSSGGSG